MTNTPPSTTRYDAGLTADPANFVSLSPLTFIERSAAVFSDRIAVVYGETRRSWAQTFTRCRQLASALRKRGVQKGDTVAVIAANTPEMFELHFGVPAAGAVLNSINTRLDADAIGFILMHGEARVVITDREFSSVVNQAVQALDQRPLVVDIDDPGYAGGELIGELDYEALIAEGDADFPWVNPQDEWDAICLNYTSGTTGNPKGVVYHHRGAYLNAVSNALAWNMPQHPVYLWTLPMFHCNGWCFPWTVALLSGTNICLRQVRVEPIFAAIKQEKVDHFCGAPIVLNTLNNAPDELKQGIKHKVKVMTAGAAPPSAVIEEMERLGIEVTHVYGLTEVYGPTVVCAWKDEWNDLPAPEKAVLKARQGVRYHMLEGLMVADPDTLVPVPRDAKTLGEVMLRGNNVMKGYLKNPQATARSFAGGWFHTGDLAVWHADGYIEIKDRSKDIIISGGENISSLEIEETLYRHPAIMEAAVVARPDTQWGETPCAFVALKDGVETTAEEIVAFCRARMAHFKAPKSVVFGPLPKTSTGKIKKFVLREQAKLL
jgi:fatty-acyl-CoA synthase